MYCVAQLELSSKWAPSYLVVISTKPFYKILITPSPKRRAALCRERNQALATLPLHFSIGRFVMKGARCVHIVAVGIGCGVKYITVIGIRLVANEHVVAVFSTVPILIHVTDGHFEIAVELGLRLFAAG